MLPITSSTSTSSSIYINPKFRNVHINPNFLTKSSNMNGKAMESMTVNAPTQIYINPRFLGNPSIQGIAMTKATQSTSIVMHPKETHTQFTAQEFHETNSLVAEPLADTKIHTRTKIINPSVKVKMADRMKIEGISSNAESAMSLIKIGSKKLIRIPEKSIAKPSKTITKVRRPLQTKYKIVKEQTAFKIDRRSAKAKLASITITVTPHILPSKKLWISESLMPTKMVKGIMSNQSVVKSSMLLPILAHGKSSSFLNINGILYKSNRRKLEKTTLSSKYSLTNAMKTPTSISKQSYRRLSVRGENFLLDASGKNLVRVQSNGKPEFNDETAKTFGTINRKRIDIGKITFVKKSNDTYERTDYHKSRYHLNVAKQRSIQMLTNRLVKTNVPCQIFRKLGKCAAFLRGKCAKLHDKKLVDVCPRFLKGSCDKNPCLLSHNTTLSKMPTCRFYLQGMCWKTDCPYLHKKVNDKTDICVDFLRGFCEKAEECSMRHEFLCPEEQSKGSCKLTRCPYPHKIQKNLHRTLKAEQFKLNKKLKITKKIIDANIPDDKIGVKRYFADESKENSETSCGSNSANQITNTENVEQIIVTRKPIIGSLPPFIPIG